MRTAAIIHDGAPADPADDLTGTIAAVADALRADGWVVETIPLLDASLDGIRADLVFNLCEGLAGDATREAAVAARLESLGLPFTGNSSAALQLCLDKPLVKERLRCAGIDVPEDEGFPLIVKPAREDASHGIDAGSVVRTPDERDRRLAVMDRPALVERYIEGREFAAAIVGNEVLPISEIDFSAMPAGHPRVVTYEAKWVPGSAADLGTRPICPARIPDALRAEIETTARNVFSLLGLRDYARIDLRQDADGRLYVLEANPNPDLAPDAGLARAAAARGWDHATLVRRIAGLALERGIEIRRLEPSHVSALERALERCGVFPPEERAVCRELLDAHLKGCAPAVYEFVSAMDGDEPAGYACTGDASMADRVFELYWIFVDPDRQRGGVGRALMAHVDAQARARGMRMTVVHTSGRREYEPARGLYLSCGYREAARLKDYYRAGDDLVIYRKDY